MKIVGNTVHAALNSQCRVPHCHDGVSTGFTGNSRPSSSVLTGDSTLAAALAVALGQLLQSSQAVALEQLLPAMEAAAGHLLSTADAEPSSLQDLVVYPHLGSLNAASCKLHFPHSPNPTTMPWRLSA